METERVEAFIKAVDEQFFDAFLNGEICMNSLKWFQKHESENAAIGDKYDGASFAISDNASFYLSPSGNREDLKLITDKARDVLLYNDNKHWNILSLYAIYEVVNGIHYIPKKFISEFNHRRFCLITAPNCFISRLENEIKKQGFSPKHRLVTYYEPDKSGKFLNPFVKRNIYSYQNEARVSFQNSRNEQKIFNIGSLQYIAKEIHPENEMYVIPDSLGNDLIIMKEP